MGCNEIIIFTAIIACNMCVYSRVKYISIVQSVERVTNLIKPLLIENWCFAAWAYKWNICYTQTKIKTNTYV